MIYLDYNATTPIDKEVANAMLPDLYGNYGNPSSTHELGITAKSAVEHARSIMYYSTQMHLSQLVRCK